MHDCIIQGFLLYIGNTPVSLKGKHFSYDHVFVFFSSWICYYRYKHPALIVPCISSRQVLRIVKWRRNVYSQLSGTQTTPNPSMILMELKLLCVHGTGPTPGMTIELQKVTSSKSKLQRTQLMEREFNFFKPSCKNSLCMLFVQRAPRT